jgi:hypothetical protein
VRQWLGFLGLRTVVRVLEKLRTVLPLTVGIRDGAVQLVSTVVAPSPQHEQGSGIIAHRGGKLAGRVVFHARQPRGGEPGIDVAFLLLPLGVSLDCPNHIVSSRPRFAMLQR